MGKRIFFSIFWLFAGVAIGVLLIVLAGILPFRYDNPIVATIGVVRPQIIGFAPYWLLDKATGPYQNYLTTYSYFGLIVGRDGHIVKLNNPQEEEPGWTTLKSDKMKNILDKRQLAYKNH